MQGGDDGRSDSEQVAGNGLLHRRALLVGGASLLSAGSLGLMKARPAQAAPPAVDDWMRVPGAGLSPYGERARFEHDVARYVSAVPGTTGAGSSRSPLEKLAGTITPNALHFERHHSGIPDIDPNRHRLLVHGLVERPLIFSIEALHRYPMISRVQFLECAGNSRPNLAAEPPDVSCGEIHGMLSCSEWTGVPLSILLEEAGVDPEADWLLAEGADAAAMSRSVPLTKAFDDAFVALYQNGEALRPSQGYPIRLFVPGWEGNISVKWLRRIKLTRGPTMTRDETSKYTDLLPSGRSLQFTFPMGVKSVITSPSGTLEMQGPGLYEISGLAWSGAGHIARVEVSADGGQSWAEAALETPALPKAVVRFRTAWRWNGGPAVLMSRATDETGAVQPLRSALVAEKGAQVSYHNNAIQCWEILENNRVRNAYS